MAKLLSDECRAGVHTVCADAAAHTDDATAAAALLGIACTAHDGTSCYALATRKAAGGPGDARLWEAACADKDFDLTEEDVSARSDACARWGKVASRSAQRRCWRSNKTLLWC